MGKLRAEISVSLDGFVAGPNQRLDNALGDNGEQLHDWVLSTVSWRSAHGKEGGETGPDDELYAENLKGIGSVIMGRRMFSGGEGPWESDPNANGWWGDEPPFHHPVFVLTHHEREPLTLSDTTFTFVTDGIESALEQARAGADGDDVLISGGGTVIQQYLGSGHLDELHVHVVPVLLGGGSPLFDGQVAEAGRLALTRAVESPTGVMHLSYRVA